MTPQPLSTEPNRHNPQFRSPLARLLLGQIGAGAGVFAVDLLVNVAGGVGLEALWMVLMQATLAALISRLAGLGMGWMAVQFALPWTAWAALDADLPSWVFLLIFVALFAVYRNVGKERVPLYLSNRTTWKALGEVLDARAQTEAPRFVDLGAGFGGTLIDLAQGRAQWQFVGIESAPLVALAARLRVALAGHSLGGGGMEKGHVEIRYHDLWDADLGQYDVVYAFLSPAPMPRLLEKAKAEMKPGSTFISNSFWADGVAYDECLEVNDRRRTQLYILRL